MERCGRQDLAADEEHDAELDDDRVEEHGADEGETSACTAYLAHQMSCLGRGRLGLKDTPFLDSARGVKEAEGVFTLMEIARLLLRWW